MKAQPKQTILMSSSVALSVAIKSEHRPKIRKLHIFYLHFAIDQRFAKKAEMVHKIWYW